MSRQPALDKFGRFLMENLRDRAIEFHEMLSRGRWKAPGLPQLQSELISLDARHQDLVRRCVVQAIDNGIHDFLSALQERSDCAGDIRVMVEGEDVAAISDRLNGELFTREGWQAQFSAHGEAESSGSGVSSEMKERWH